MTTHPLTEGMNRQQQQAITAGDGPVLVLAGPGSGKTAVLTRRIAWLIRERNVPHYRIMAVTFTNKATDEMRSRLAQMLDGNLNGMQIGTFHASRRDCCGVKLSCLAIVPTGRYYRQMRNTGSFGAFWSGLLPKTCLSAQPVYGRRFLWRRIA